MKTKYFIMMLLVASFCSCKKWLDAKPDNKLAVPASLNDLRLLLDQNNTMNLRYSNRAEVAADNFYVTTTDWQSVTDLSARNYYLWEKDDRQVNDWANLYLIVLHANIVLEYIDKIPIQPTENALQEQLKGEALYYRAFAFYQASQLFCEGYDGSSLGKPGIPLRLNSDLNEFSTRGNVAAVYDRIISDLANAAINLPITSALLTRPSKSAAFAMLSRVYLCMNDPTKTRQFADSALSYNNSLLDYNGLNAAVANPIGRFNTEVYFHATSITNLILLPSRCKIDSSLYTSYAANDLRKVIYFKNNGNGTYAFKGDYGEANNGSLFLGPTTAEIILNRAEAHARLGNTGAALNDLNALLVKRWKAGTFIPVTAGNSIDALGKILVERRKELLFRGLRWTDLRRLNRQPGYESTLKRIIGGQTYTLVPNGVRYTFLLPKIVIDLSGMDQNP